MSSNITDLTMVEASWNDLPTKMAISSPFGEPDTHGNFWYCVSCDTYERDCDGFPSGYFSKDHRSFRSDEHMWEHLRCRHGFDIFEYGNRRYHIEESGLVETCICQEARDEDLKGVEKVDAVGSPKTGLETTLLAAEKTTEEREK